MFLRHLIIALSLLAAVRPVNAQGIHWVLDIDEAKRQAYAENKFLLLLFEYASYDRSARMTSDVWNQDSIVALSRTYVCVRVDYEMMRTSHNIVLKDKNQKLSTRYRVTYLPTVVITDPPGNALIRFTDEIPLSDITGIMRSLPGDLNHLYGVLLQLETSPADIGLQLAAADEYQHLEVSHLSSMYYSQVEENDTMKNDTRLAERVQSAQALNFERLGQVVKAIEIFERLLDTRPQSANRPYQLYMLTKLYSKRLRAIRARDYYNILSKEYPKSEYTFRAWELLKE